LTVARIHSTKKAPERSRTLEAAHHADGRSVASGVRPVDFRGAGGLIGTLSGMHGAPVGNHKYLTLDGLRGVAAIAVVFWHGQALALSHLPSAYLAVDLFFLMSGFVIAHAYEGRLQADMTFGAFMAARIRRLYPLYILGTALGLAYLVAFRFVSSEPARPISELTIAALTAAFYLPTPSSDPSRFLFPLNIAAWSLFFEMVVNVAYALIARRLTDRLLWLIVGVAAAALVATGSYFPTMDVGWNWGNATGGLPRVTFSFFAGVLLYRKRHALPAFSAPTWSILAVGLALLCVPMSGPLALPWTLGVILVGFPLLSAAAIQTEPTRLAGLFAAAGAVSYPIYALHRPLIDWAYGASKTLGLAPTDHPVMGWAILGGMLAASWLALKWFDEPVRAALSPKRPARAVVQQGAAG
jgi:peptidoglycan/LPS O-acetylase OafA/YrhL